MTRQEVIDHALTIADKCTVGRIVRAMNRFKTVSDFFAAGYGDVMAAYAAATPSSTKGLGLKSKVCLDMLREWYQANKDKPDLVDLAKRIDLAPSPRQMVKAMAWDNVHPAPIRQSKFYTLGKLKAIVALMELANMSEIDIERMDDFFSACKIDIEVLDGVRKEDNR